MEYMLVRAETHELFTARVNEALADGW